MATALPTIVREPLPGKAYDLILTDFIARKLGLGRVMTGHILKVTANGLLVRGESVLRPTASGACRRCRRPLSDAASKALGYGPDCLAALGVTNKILRSWDLAPSEDELARARKAVAFEGWLPRSQVHVVEEGGTAAHEAKLRREAEARAGDGGARASFAHADLEATRLEVPVGEKLFAHQPIGVTFALKNKRSLNGDEPGLGKTCQAALFMKHASYDLQERGLPRKVLYVTLATLKRNAAREIKRWWPKARVEVIDKRSDRPKRKADVYVVNYDILAQRDGNCGLRLSDALRAVVGYGIGTLVVDESHRAKTEGANRTEALIEIGGQVEYALLMSGTLVVNRPRELVTQLKIAGVFADLFPEGEDEYRRKFCEAKVRLIHRKVNGRVQVRRVWDDSGAAHLDELHDRLAAVMIRRRKHEVLVDKDGNRLLPDKQYATVVVELENRAEYDRYEEAIVAAPDDQKLGMLSHARELASIGKARAAVDLAASLIEAGQKVVVFASFKESQRMLCAMLPGARHILASDSQKARDEAERAFNSDPEEKVIVVSTLAGGVGLTLHASGACSNAILVDLDWTAANLDQAHDRIHRIGQTAESVTIWTLVADATIDDKLAEMVAEKRVVTGRILDGEQLAAEEARMKREVLNEIEARVRVRKKAA